MNSILSSIDHDPEHDVDVSLFFEAESSDSVSSTHSPVALFLMCPTKWTSDDLSANSDIMLQCPPPGLCVKKTYIPNKKLIVKRKKYFRMYYHSSVKY